MTEATYGDETLRVVREVSQQGASRIALLMRHSAREFRRDLHDLENPLTDEGRALSSRFGARLPASFALRGYASPPERCQETARLALAAHPGEATRVRAVESLGVFYALDQQKVWKQLMALDGLAEFVARWSEESLVADALIPAQLAAELVLRSTLVRLRTAPNGGASHLDVCVSHDMTVMLVRHQLLQEHALDYPVEFLDGLVLYELDGLVYLRSQHGAAVDVTELCHA